MPAIVTVQKKELERHPKVLSEVQPYCNSVIDADDHLILEPKAGYLTSLTMTVSKQKLSYEVTYRDTRFTQEQLSKVLTGHA